MLRIAGELDKLIEIAEKTDSLPALKKKLAYLNEWGEGAGCYVNVDMLIGKVNIDRNDVEVAIAFYGSPHNPIGFRGSGVINMHGGLNLCRSSEDGWSWSVNT